MEKEQKMNKKQDVFIWKFILLFGFYVWGLNMGIASSKGVISHTFTWIFFGTLILLVIVMDLV